MMKEMIYGNERSFSLLFEQDIQGYKIVIINLGTHPCGYIGVPKGNLLEEVGYNKLGDDGIWGDKVNGGFTYAGRGVSKLHKEIWFFGWDYAHCGDYVGYSSFGFSGDDKKWTTEEIYQQCLEQLKELIRIKKGITGKFKLRKKK